MQVAAHWSALLSGTRSQAQQSAESSVPELEWQSATVCRTTRIMSATGISQLSKTPTGMEMSMSHGEEMGERSVSEYETAAAPANWPSRIATLGGIAAAEIYWLYAIFVAHVLAISVYTTDRSSNLRLTVGQIGNIGETIHFNGAVGSVITCLGLFALVWCVVRGGFLGIFSETRICRQARSSQ